jgi:hypothetical protein
VRAAGDAVATVRREVGRQLILVAIIPSGSGMPDREGLAELVRLGPMIERVCETQFAVLQGDSFATTLVRASLAAVTAVMRRPAMIAATVEEAVTLACRQVMLDPSAVMEEARARGLLSSGEPR